VKHIRFIRAHADGEVYSGPGQCDEAAFEVLKGLPSGGDLIALPPGNQARMDDKINLDTLQIIRKGPLKKVSLEKALASAAKSDVEVVTIEELTDAVIKLAAGDRSAVDGIALRRKRQIKKAEKDGADPGRAAQRSAGRHKAASK
jgi:hypothetical protein